MSGGKDDIYMFGNSKRDNIIFTINAGVTVTCFFRSNESDTASEKYFNLGDTAKKVRIIVDNAATITHIQSRELKSPITLSVGGNVYGKNGGIEWNTIKVRADSDSTTFEIYAS